MGLLYSFTATFEGTGYGNGNGKTPRQNANAKLICNCFFPTAQLDFIFIVLRNAVTAMPSYW